MFMSPHPSSLDVHDRNPLPDVLLAPDPHWGGVPGLAATLVKELVHPVVSNKKQN